MIRPLKTTQEPTSDKFTVVIHGEEDRPVEGNSLAVIKELPYEGLTRFGTGCASGLKNKSSLAYVTRQLTGDAWLAWLNPRPLDCFFFPL